MLGLINEVAELLVISKFGLDAWHTIKEKAGCDVKDYGFVRHDYYPDSATIAVVGAAAETLGVTVDVVLELFGQFFIEYTRKNGYANLLSCQGSNLRLWLSNLNALHDHLHSSLPKEASFPTFWCEDCDTVKGTILLHYFSHRGSLFAPIVVGIVKEAATYYFDVEIAMERLATQGEDGSSCTIWRVSANDPDQSTKLTGDDEKPIKPSEQNGGYHQSRRMMERRRTLETNNTGTFHHFDHHEHENNNNMTACPFSGASIDPAQIAEAIATAHSQQEQASSPSVVEEEKSRTRLSGIRRWFNIQKLACPHPVRLSCLLSPSKSTPRPKSEETCSVRSQDHAQEHALPSDQLGFSAEQTQEIFPYHVFVDGDFQILQVGRRLPKLLGKDTEELIGNFIGDILTISKPRLGKWNWSSLHKLADQTFYLIPVVKNDRQSGVRIEKSQDPVVKFKGNMIAASENRVMFVLSPRAKNISELSDMGLTMSDLPLHSFQRDAIFLGEHIASEVRSARKLDKLSKRLENERNLSNTLLYNMLPRSVAEELRAGRTVEPTHYEKVTLFFSDIVGFTSLCDSIESWGIVDMLNQLYSVMDYLAQHFNLYKVETIGDAYVCCSGLPVPDEMHAENIANFAIAVKECVKLVLSPADGMSINLRIGIHTGHCVGGVVGTLTPHYCLFGDMVNTTARHESTGEPGRIQCSSVLYGLLKHFSIHDDEQYKFTPRGLVPMKGKGEVYTYWLDEGTEHNEGASPAAVKHLFTEVQEMLGKKTWRKRRYFRRSSMFHDESVCSGSDAMTMLDSSTIDFGDSQVWTDAGTEGTEEVEHNDAMGSVIGSEADSAGSEEREQTLNELDDLIGADSTADDVDELTPSSHNVFSLDSEKHCNKHSWADVGWDPDLSREDLVGGVHDLMLTLLSQCLLVESDAELPDNWNVLDSELYGFIHRISTLYRTDPPFHNWRHACHVVLGASFLISRAQEGGEEGMGLKPDSWIRLAAAFAALIHDAKHLGVPNRQLEVEHNVLCEVYDGSLQEWQSVHTGISIFTVDFPRLSREIIKGCPLFIHLVTSAVLATDIASSEVQQRTKEKFQRSVSSFDRDSSEYSPDVFRSEDERTEAVLEQFILLADVSHCSQKFSTFLRWNRAFYMECLKNHLGKRGDDPRSGWYDGQIGFLQNYILPLAERCERLLPQSCGLKEGVENNLTRWKAEGCQWTNSMIEELS